MSERLSEEECEKLAEDIEDLLEAEALAEEEYDGAKEALREKINETLKAATGYDLDDYAQAQRDSDTANERARDMEIDEYIDGIDDALDELEAADKEVADREKDVDEATKAVNAIADRLLGDPAGSGSADSYSENLAAYERAQAELQDAITALGTAQSRQAAAAREVARLNDLLPDQDEVDEVQEEVKSTGEKLNEISFAIKEAREDDPQLDEDMRGYDYGNHESYDGPLKAWLDAKQERTDAQKYRDEHCGDDEGEDADNEGEDDGGGEEGEDE